MRPIVASLRQKSENYHMFIHFLLGLVCAYALRDVFPEASMNRQLILGVLGNLLPDFDHLIYIFFYGKHSEYAQIVKYFLKNRELKNVARFIKTNHKYNTGVYSHNFLSLFIAIGIFWFIGQTRDHAGTAVFFLSWTTHYLFDLIEDLLFFRHPNPNWYLKFNRHPTTSSFFMDRNANQRSKK